MHIISGGDSKHLEKDRDQICFKREGTLALNLFVDVLVRIVDVVDLDHGLVPHIDSGSYREEAKHRKGRTTFNMASMQCAYKNDGMTMLKNCI